MKICCKCKREKSEDDFKKNNQREDRCYSQCKTCQKEYYKEYGKRYRTTNRDALDKKNKNYWEQNKEKLKNYQRSYNERNRERRQRWRREYYKKNREREKENALKNLYGISLNEMQEIYVLQNGLCKICKKKLETRTGTHVDHDHKTKIVRGLLCPSCNKLLGYANEDIQVLSNAIKYLSGGLHL